jgi:flagella basal body P-ring formation protein FlgA
MVIDGPVIVHARGYANQDGVVGDLIQVRRDGIDHLLTCQVIGAGQTQLEE